MAVIGLGYIGLPTAAVLAAHGIDVLGVDINEDTVAAVNEGRVHIVEPDLANLLVEATGSGRLRASTRPEVADAYILAVPTPFTDRREPDLTYIRAAARSLAPLLTGGELLVLESTSPPGATRQLADWIFELRPDLGLDEREGRPTIHFAHCPERVIPGRAVVEIVENDRVIGGLTQQAAQRARDLYATFCKGEIHITDAATAEMTKLVENAYRDVNIAFANELSLISDSLGLDVWELIRLANHHPRVNILQPGPGVGGHCIAVDPWFIVDAAPDHAQLIHQARMVNDYKPHWVVGKILGVVREHRPATVALLGMSFKPDIDDLRESAARVVIKKVSEILRDTQILVVEPNIGELPEDLAGRDNVHLVSLDEALDRSEVRVVLVAHQEFRDLGDRENVRSHGLTMSFAGEVRGLTATAKGAKNVLQ